MNIPIFTLPDLRDWYWIVGGNASQIYSSKLNAYVEPSDEAYVAWLASGNVASPIASEADLWTSVGSVLPSSLWNGSTFISASPADYAKAQLKAYAADKRWQKEVGGTDVGGVDYLSDRETQSKLTAAVVMAQVNPAATFQWKVADGSFVELDAGDMLTVASTIGAYVQACFALEGSVVAEIEAGEIITKAEIDAAFA